MAGTTQALASGTRPVTVASSTAPSTPDPTDEHVADVMRVRAAAMAEARESAVELLARRGGRRTFRRRPGRGRSSDSSGARR